MLDFGKLMQQIEMVGQDSLEPKILPNQLLLNAQQAYDCACRDQAAFNDKLTADGTQVLWPVAIPLEPLTQSVDIAQAKDNYTIIAVDGSQIMPSQHEIHNCFLLNIGFVQLSYGKQLPPLLESQPHLYHRPEDLYPLVDRRRLHIDELYVSLERSLLEFEYLVTKAAQAVESGLPVLAMVDGSLIPWSVQRMPESYQRRYLDRCSALMIALRELGVAVVGYISHSRSSDIVNDLRVSLCPYEESRCKEHCGDLNEDDFPCSVIWPLHDRTMLSGHLSEYHRTPTFLSGASVSKLFAPDLRICFVYVNVKDEIARIEFPRWIFTQEHMLNTALGAVISQVRKGMGYPVALAEAHHLAVIKGNDRKQFFDMLTRHLVSIGANQVGLSPKEKKKRVGLV